MFLNEGECSEEISTLFVARIDGWRAFKRVRDISLLLEAIDRSEYSLEFIIRPNCTASFYLFLNWMDLVIDAVSKLMSYKKPSSTETRACELSYSFVKQATPRW